MHVCVPNLKGSILSVEPHFLLQFLKFHKTYVLFLLDLDHYGSYTVASAQRYSTIKIMTAPSSVQLH